MDVELVVVGALPQELVQVLNQTYFLHLLATEPQLVLPEGKSWLSMIAHSRLTPQTTEPVTLRDSVQRAVHNAFWSEALEALAGSISSQIDRLKLLLLDVKEAICPLFPNDHPILVTLSAPVPPTASPLMSTKFLLKDILVALRERAAPARDSIIDGILADLDAPRSPTSITTSSITSELALLIISTMKSIFALADAMKTDLNEFVVGFMTESQMRAILVQQAKTREKELVLEVWGQSGKDGKERVQEMWQAWVDELEGHDASEFQPRDKWIRRLIRALASTKPVSCTIPNLVSTDKSVQDAAGGNELPPQLLFSVPRLLYAQNYLQALVVAASLRSLTRLPAESNSRSDFMDRVWTLLEAEIEEEVSSATGSKIVNFADEVIRARRLISTPDKQEEDSLRAAVDRTLQYGDPVFLLLQKRMLAALAHQLCEPLVNNASHRSAPDQMQTGRTVGQRRPENHRPPPVMPSVKGFEDPVLVSRIEDIFGRLRQHVEWAHTVWFHNSFSDVDK
ncbi:hypothetical protein GGX14DRAFT_598959 [Mycena pura]|uniref:Uncharacterized protein n=1 Tax=Mycena pura TaxID=153505 RepID=A0AAD6VNA1_9AGAR|nr:hypothetical protein GGX14DRAFT_598959 [Mycena pura]